MQQSSLKQIITCICIPAALLSLAWLTGGSDTNTQTILIQCTFLTLMIHWIIGAISVALQTEKVFDITGTIAVWCMIAFINNQTNTTAERGLILSSCCLLWTTRLGLFLLIRIHKHKKDRRFDQLKTNKYNFFNTWQLSATWTLITLLSALTAISSPQNAPMTTVDYSILSMWSLAFVTEAIADRQKMPFKTQKQNTPFIQTGLWKYSRHPNYLAEITMWICIAGLAYPNLFGSLYISLISPIFVGVLLTRVSGINLLEEASDKKYGHLKSYQRYKKNTPRLIPNPLYFISKK